MSNTIIRGKQIPGSPGMDSAAAGAITVVEGVLFVLLVTTAGTFDFTTANGTARTGVALPAGLYPVYLKSIEAIAGGGAGEVIYQ